MEIKYILVYGNPYIQVKFFDNFNKMSNYIVRKHIVLYRIYEQMNDEKEIYKILKGEK